MGFGWLRHRKGPKRPSFNVLLRVQVGSVRLQRRLFFKPGMMNPAGPRTHCLRTPVPNTIPLMVFGTRVLKYWVLGPSGEAFRAGVRRVTSLCHPWIRWPASPVIFQRLLR